MEPICYDNYEVHIDDLKWRGKECNEWMNCLLPPKKKKQRTENNSSYAAQKSTMNATELQKLYSRMYGGPGLLDLILAKSEMFRLSYETSTKLAR